VAICTRRAQTGQAAAHTQHRRASKERAASTNNKQRPAPKNTPQTTRLPCVTHLLHVLLLARDVREQGQVAADAAMGQRQRRAQQNAAKHTRPTGAKEQQTLRLPSPRTHLLPILLRASRRCRGWSEASVAAPCDSRSLSADSEQIFAATGGECGSAAAGQSCTTSV
jgi:hypothetical protein